MNTPKRHIKKLIEQDKLEKALSELSNFDLDDEQQKTLSLLKARLIALKTANIRGIKTLDQASSTRSEIKLAVLEFLSILENVSGKAVQHKQESVEEIALLEAKLRNTRNHMVQREIRAEIDRLKSRNKNHD